MRMCGTGLRCNTSRQWLTKKVLFSAQRSSAVLFVSHVVCTFLLAFERLSPNVSETWMILTRKRLLGDIFVTRRLSKSFAFQEFECINFEPWTFQSIVRVFLPLVFPIKVPGELDPLSFHKLFVDMYVSKTKFERNSSLEYNHMTSIGKTKHIS